MPPYPPKPLAGHVLGKGYEKKGKREKKPPGKNHSLTPSRELHLSWNVFIRLFPHVWINAHLLVTGPGTWLFVCVPLGWWLRLLFRGPPSIPVVSPSGRSDKSCCFNWCSKGNGIVEWKGPPERACLPLFHNIGSTTSLLTQYKALSYGFGLTTAISGQS